VRAAVFAVALAVAPLGWTSGALAVEQTIVPLAPAEEQTVRPIGSVEPTQHVQTVASGEQQVAPAVPPSPAAKAASAVGKGVLAVLTAGVALAASAAMLLLL
jgi:hypothetical protein